MIKNRLFYISLFLSISSVAISQNLSSSVYNWEKLKVNKTTYGEVRSFFKNPSRSLEMFEIKAVTLNPHMDLRGEKIEKGTDELLIIKEGIIEITVNNEHRVLGEGSVVVASPDDEVNFSDRQNDKATYFSIRFKPNQKGGQLEIANQVPPIFVDWKNVEFKASANGGRRNIMQQKTSALRELEIHVTTIKEGMSSHAGHTHTDEEIILVRYGDVEMVVNEVHLKGGPGSVFFLTNDDFHGLTNAGKGACEYYAIRWLIN